MNSKGWSWDQVVTNFLERGAAREPTLQAEVERTLADADRRLQNGSTEVFGAPSTHGQHSAVNSTAESSTL